MRSSGRDRRPLVVMRADGSDAIGLGHVMRSLTLARALEESGCLVRFIGAGVPAEPRSWRPAGVAIIDRTCPGDAHEDAAAIIEQRPDLVVVDGDHFTADFFDRLADAEIRHAVIDDNGDTPSSEPVLVVNQNPHADPSMYDAMAGEPELLLGLDFALIRPEVVDVSRRSVQRTADTVFLAMGGSDPLRLTVPIAEAISQPGRAVRVALGPAHGARDEAILALARLDEVTLVQPADYVAELASCELAIIAAGSTLWESSRLGTPTIAVLVADNQRHSALAALRLGIIRAVHDPASCPIKALLEELLRVDTTPSPEYGNVSVDGWGAARVAARVLRLGRAS